MKNTKNIMLAVTCFFLSNLPAFSMITIDDESDKKPPTIATGAYPSSHSTTSNDVGSSSSSALTVIPHKFISEVFLDKELGQLEKTGQIVYSPTLNKEAELYKCNEQTFSTILPTYSPLNYDIVSGDIGFSVGQIIKTNGRAVGTGTLVSVNKVEGEIRISGITAAHIFITITAEDGVTWPRRFLRKFVLGSMIHPTDHGQYYTLGEVSVDTIMVQKTPMKDICLFEGVFQYNPELFINNDEFITKFKSIPLIIEENITAVEVWDSTMHHYPLGKKDQRRNEGNALGVGKHTIESLFGSSGAALFNTDRKIFGIHTGANYEDLIGYEDSDIGKVAEYDGEKDIPFGKYNTFELFSQLEYAELINGINLYNDNDGHPAEFLMNLSKLAEKSQI